MTISLTRLAAPTGKIALPIVAAALLVAACGSSSGGSGAGGSGAGGSGAGGGGAGGSSAASSAAASPSMSSSGGAATTATTSIIATDGHLTDASGRTVYLWSADTAGKSTCAGSCASAWPPVPGTAKAGTGVSSAKLSTITRAGGGTQLAYAGHPLYYFEGDTSPGQARGQGADSFGAKWWELNAAGKAITSGTAPGGGTSSKPASSSSSASAGGGYGY
jgi:predicted lipoprotein with Yx(FWY)xxD motif